MNQETFNKIVQSNIESILDKDIFAEIPLREIESLDFPLSKEKAVALANSNQVYAGIDEKKYWSNV